MSKFIFGYGSLCNNESRCGSTGSGNAESEKNALFVRVSAQWGYIRAFCARSQTGFTSLGLLKQKASSEKVESGGGIVGVVFPVTSSELSAFDIRERGYDRILLPQQYIEIIISQHALDLRITHEDTVYAYVPRPEITLAATRDFPIIQTYVDTCLSGMMSWGGESMMEDFVLNTHWWSPHFLNDCPLSRRPWLHRKHYVEVDDVLTKHQAHTFMLFRRHAEEYGGSDRGRTTDAGAENTAAGPTDGRRALTGLWGCPPRNPLFAGREGVLAALHGGLQNDGFAELSGLGGIGKSSVAAEFCSRHYGTTYGLIVFLRAESRASIAADIRKFASDLNLLQANPGAGAQQKSYLSPRATSSDSDDGEPSIDFDDDRLIEDFKRHLAVLQTRCLIVFDNLECIAGSGMNSRAAVAAYLPRGRLAVDDRSTAVEASNGASLDSRLDNGKNIAGSSSAAGASTHVLVTRRVAGVSSNVGHSCNIALEQFRPAESLQYLAKALQFQADDATGAAGKCEEEDELKDLQILAERLHHLPLALSQAVAFVKRTDVSTAEYLRRLDRSVSGMHSSAADIALDSVYISLEMALSQIERESVVSVRTLQRLAWMSPDNITKSLVLQLLKAINVFEQQKQQYTMKAEKRMRRIRSTVAVATITGLGAAAIALRFQPQNSLISSKEDGKRSALQRLLHRVGVFAAATLSAGVCGWTAWMALAHSGDMRTSGKGLLAAGRSHAATSDLLPEADHVWELLKQFGLLTVRGSRRARVASMHRLQQQFLRRQMKSSSLVSAESGPYMCSHASQCIEECTWALNQLWDLSSLAMVTGNTDASSSGEASPAVNRSELLQHVQMLAQHISTELTRLEQEKHLCPAKRNPWDLSETSMLQLAYLLARAAAHATTALSHFDMSETLLALSLELQQEIIAIDNMHHSTNATTRDDGDGVDIASRRTLLARTHHSYGSLSRLRGNLDRAREHLLQSLSLRQSSQSDSKPPEQELLIADTLHELGIVDLRQGLLGAAQARLADSLSIKLRCRSQKSKSEVYKISGHSASNVPTFAPFETDVSEASSSVSATLHQLAVVATLGKKYDDAEKLLKQALALDSTSMDTGHENRGRRGSSVQNTRILVSRAAATQQLGRVYLRRGQLQQALLFGTEALTLYSQAYGDMQHINVATALHQLGSIQAAMGDYAKAREHFQNALIMRQSIFPPEHVELLRTYAEIAQCVSDQGHAPEAESLWLEQQTRAERILQSALSHSRDTQETTLISVLSKHLLTALYARRMHCRRRKDQALVTELTARIGVIRKLQDGATPPVPDTDSASEILLLAGLMSKDKADNTGSLSTVDTKSSQSPPEQSIRLRAAVLSARTAVRCQARLFAKESNSTQSATAIDDVLTHAYSFQQGMLALSQQVGEMIETVVVDGEYIEEESHGSSLGAASISYTDKALILAARRLCATVHTLTRKADIQVQALEAEASSPSAFGVSGDLDHTKRVQHQRMQLQILATTLSDELYRACDQLRADVQALGGQVED